MYRALLRIPCWRRCCALAAAVRWSCRPRIRRAELQITGKIPFIQQRGEAALARIHPREAAALRELAQSFAGAPAHLRQLAIDEEQRSQIKHLRLELEAHAIALSLPHKCAPGQRRWYTLKHHVRLRFGQMLTQEARDIGGAPFQPRELIADLADHSGWDARRLPVGRELAVFIHSIERDLIFEVAQKRYGKVMPGR